MLDIETRSASSLGGGGGGGSGSLRSEAGPGESTGEAADLHAEDVPADRNAEYFEFRLARSDQLRCARGGQQQQDAAACGACESCRLLEATRSVRQWFWRCGHSTQWRFLSGLLQRFRSADLARYVVHVTSPHDGSKDRTYARSRSRPGMLTDRASCAALAVPEGSASGDRALDAGAVERWVADAWAWFADATYWTKVNYVLALLRCCDSELLALVCRQAQTLLAVESRAAAHKESLSVSRASSAVTARTRSALSGDGDKPDADEQMDSPELLVLLNAPKAYSGMARYKDFICKLPVHLSKYILGMLDEATLYSCQKVSLAWRQLVDETQKEFFTNQQKQEDIMLMQGSSGVNPTYANDLSVLVPNIDGETGEVLATSETVVEARFKSEMSMANAYSGFSTRRVIMEERNVYCGSYNVLVLVSEPYTQRAMHTSGGKYVAVDSTDRRIHLVEMATASESLPPIAGHSGPIRAIHVNEAEGFVLSGSFDTSIRKWDLRSRKCKRIFNGHQETVVALDYCSELQRFASASLDGSAKVWDIGTGKCVRTFKHKHPVMCVALSQELCISGCQAGRVKVWNLETGKLVKLLAGHKGEITAVKFDKWHIVTTSRDGYALAWSSQGKHDKCVMALRHPCEVTSVEFMYLRVITGAEDGRVRIWNLITGQCCRIMRGNSQSDPIISLTAAGDCLTVNTKSNVLMLSFESVEWDYSLGTDKMSSLVPSNAFARSPLKPRSYAYARAHRSEQADCADRRLLTRSAAPSRLRSAQSRRARSVAAATSDDGRRRRWRVSGGGDGGGGSADSVGLEDDGEHRADSEPTRVSDVTVWQPSARTAQAVVTASHSGRRVSWAFQSSDISCFGDTSLDEVKTILKRQIRGGVGEVHGHSGSLLRPTVSGYDGGGSGCDGDDAMPSDARKSPGRPHSSPPKVDSRVKVKVSRSQWTELLGRDWAGEAAPGTLSERRTPPTGELRPMTAPPQPASRGAEPPPPDLVRFADTLGMTVTRRSASVIERHRCGPLSTTATEMCTVPMLMYPSVAAAALSSDGKGEMKQPQSAPARAAVPAAYSLCSFTPLRLKTYTQEQMVVRTKTSPRAATAKAASRTSN